MLSEYQAAELGIQACKQALGEKWETAADRCCTYGPAGNRYFCFVGVEDHPEQQFFTGALALDNVSRFSNWATCFVRQEDGIIENLICK